ncbi:TetR/AcrR family transcriptional regulator [Specibacter cremeus]|uniref:TetR/AcrR family transcriptional regulator n=1 Tax=Specibacter cremeus TaxID=1629051 RepID=UPI000F799AB3|nr:TetR/AcrR family transcriptional regulator [Specibacter cremeus]
MTTPPPARDRILQAYEDLLINDGARGATLDAVAAAAGVSKGGLLYHFKSKEALTAGLIAKLRELAEADFEGMRNDPAGPSDYYVRTSVLSGSTFDRALLAAMRLAQEDDSNVRAAFTDIHAEWYRLLLADVGDAGVARAIMLIGDGLYYSAALYGLPSDGTLPARNAGDVSVASLLDIVEDLRARARGN